MAGHSHHHDHSHDTGNGDRRLLIAVAVNLLLTLAQVIGGLIAGSLSLIADALHNLSDAASLGISVFARLIGRRPANHFKTFGYKRAELIAAMINLVTLIILGLYLVVEALARFHQPQEVEGWIVVWIAAIALVINTITAMLTWSLSRHSLNIRTAFLHNLSDAMTSVGVIIAGILILRFGWYWVDPLMTLLIAGYVLYQGVSLLPQTIHILMEGTPSHIHIAEIMADMEAVEQVEGVHHLHVWQLDEHRLALEAHVVVSRVNLEDIEVIKQRLRQRLHDHWTIEHTTLEIELQGVAGECNGSSGEAGLHCHPGH